MADIPQLIDAQTYVQYARTSSQSLDVEKALGAARKCLSEPPPSIRSPKYITDMTLSRIPSVFYSFAVLQLLGPFLTSNAAVQEAVFDLWPKMWRWVLFLKEFDRISPELTLPSLAEPLAAIRSLVESGFVMQALQVMLGHVSFGTTMSQTPGFCAALSQWWNEEKPDELTEVKSWAEASPSLLISRLLQGPTGQRQFIASFGPYAFACAVLERMPKRVIPHIAYLKWLQQFLSMVNNVSCCTEFPEIEKVFFDADIIPKLVGLIQKLGTLELANLKTERGKCIVMAFRCMTCVVQQSGNVRPWVTRALNRSDFLACHRDHIGITPSIDESIESNLYHMRVQLVNHSVLRYMRSAVDKLEDADAKAADLGDSAKPRRWDEHKKWRELLEEFEAKDRARQNFDALVDLTCSNSQCKTGSTSDLKRCTGCSVSLYCSRECQTQDWPAHKSSCKAMQKSSDDGSLTGGPTPRDQQFLDFLSSWDLERNIAHLQGLFAAHMGTPLSKIYLDVEYSYAPKPHLRILSVEKNPVLQNAHWTVMTARARESRGAEIVVSVRTVYAGTLTSKKDLRTQRLHVWRFPDEIRRSQIVNLNS